MMIFSNVSQVKSLLKKEAASVEEWLSSCLDNKDLLPRLPIGLHQAMSYSLLAGGKRIRPVLCILSARMFGEKTENILPFAAGIECIHTYSLIHDDLPAMDNDDLRRGKPSNHKQFDEPTAILAGDSLLTDAFTFMGSVQTIPADRLLRALVEVAKAAGSSGMAGGQFLDMAYTMQPNITIDELAHMQAMKTGALIRASCTTGAILAGTKQSDINALDSYGTAIGAAFQIMDDILDIVGTEEELGKPVGSDQNTHKTTYPLLLGLNDSKQFAIKNAKAAQSALAPFVGPEADLLKGLAAYIVNRIS